MSPTIRITPVDPLATDLDRWPADVDLILSAMEAARPAEANRRQSLRRPHRVIARLSLFCSPGGELPTQLYVRDCTERHLGFLTQQPVPLGYGGTVDLLGPDGQPLSAGCLVYRCRECVPGWYEGVLHFNRPQPSLRFPTE